MDPNRWTAVNRIFHAALEVPAGDRQGFVLTASEGDPDLQRDVIRLLEADSQAESYLETPLVAGGLALDPSPSPIEAGETLKGRFRIERLVGQGGMGHVFEAFDLDLKVRVALKVIRPEVAANPTALEYFRREVRTARTITHGNVCRTFDLDRCRLRSGTEEARDLYFLTMEFLDGETLAEHIRRDGALAMGQARAIAGQIAAGLQCAHAAGVIHRDLKPGNIMLVPGRDAGAPSRAVVMDFGLARYPMAGDGSAISHGALVGTLAYMAPEQLDPGAPVSAATDVYAFGLILYEMVTGKRAYPSTNLLSGIAQRLSGAPPSAKALVLGLPDAWEHAIEGCLRPAASDRPQSAAEVIEALEGQAVAPPRRPKRRGGLRSALPAWRLRRWSIAAGALVCVSLFLVWLRLYPRSGNPQVTPGALVYLAPVRNQTGEKALDSLTELLEAGLSQSVQINLLDQGRVGDTLQLMTKPPDTPITEPIAREIAWRTGAARVVIPTVSGGNGAYTLHIDIQQLDDTPARYRDHWPRDFAFHTPGAAVATGQIPRELANEIRKASDWIRFEAGESKNDIARLDTPPEDVTTSGWEALEEFGRARSLYQNGRAEDAVANLEDAVQLDPKFALAYGTLGDVLCSLHRQREGLDSYQKSLELAVQNRLTKREEDRIRGMRAVDIGEYELAIQAFRDLAANYPNDPAAWTYPTIPLRMLDRDDEAVANLELALKLAPEQPFPPYALAQESMIEGRMNEAEHWIDYSRAHGHSDDADENEGVYRVLRDEYPLAQEAFESLERSADGEERNLAIMHLANLYVETGRPHEAIAILSKGTSADAARNNLDGGMDRLLARAYVEAISGEFEEALVDEHSSYSRKPSIEYAQLAASVLGNVYFNSSRRYGVRVRRELGEVIATLPGATDDKLSRIARLHAEGELSLAEGREAEGLKTLSAAANLDLPAWGHDYLARAFALVAKGRSTSGYRDAAARIWGSISQNRAGVLTSIWKFPPGFLRNVRKEASLNNLEPDEEKTK